MNSRFTVFLLLALSLCALVAVSLISVTSRALDPLSAGPLPLTAKNIRTARDAYDHGLIYKDEDCFFKAEQIQRTEVLVSLLPADMCKLRTKELVYLGKSNTLVACVSQKAEFAMKVVIGSHGIGKTREGNRKSPFGTYWLGHPRHSKMFGMFIPVGYPNLLNISAGHTGSAIGIHGPTRGLHCHPDVTLVRNWTAGCIAVGRDSQIIALSEWVLANWPARIVITKD